MDDRPGTVAELAARMDALLAPLEAAADPRRFFLATYRRTTLAVDAEIRRGGFVDGPWVERWDVVSAGLYLGQLLAQGVLAPNRLARGRHAPSTASRGSAVAEARQSTGLDLPPWSPAWSRAS